MKKPGNIPLQEVSILKCTKKDIGLCVNMLDSHQQKNQMKDAIANIQSTSILIEDFMQKNQNIITIEDKYNLHSILLNVNSISSNLDSILSKWIKEI